MSAWVFLDPLCKSWRRSVSGWFPMRDKPSGQLEKECKLRQMWPWSSSLFWDLWLSLSLSPPNLSHIISRLSTCHLSHSIHSFLFITQLSLDHNTPPAPLLSDKLWHPSKHYLSSKLRRPSHLILSYCHELEPLFTNGLNNRLGLIINLIFMQSFQRLSRFPRKQYRPFGKDHTTITLKGCNY